MSLLLYHSRRVGFPTTFCTLSCGHGLSFAESDGVNRSTCTERALFFVFVLLLELELELEST